MKKLLLLLILLAGMSQAQTTVAPFLNSEIQLLDNNGAVCSGCFLDTFAAGTTTPLVTYSESTGTTPNSNPIVLSSAGRATVYLTSASYKFRLRSAAGVTLWTQDQISWATPLSTFAGISDAGNFTQTQPTAATSGANQSSFNDCMNGNYWTGSISATDSWCLQDVLGTGSNPTSTFTLTHSGSSGAQTFSIPSAALSLGGAFSPKNINNIQFASQYAGADWCAKAAAADTALGTKGGQIWVDKSAGTSCAAGFTLHNSLMFIDDADYSQRTITIGTGGIKIEGMGLTNAGSTPFGTRLTYVGSAGSDMFDVVGSSGSQLDKVGFENLLINGNNSARYDLLVQWANAGTVKDVRFQGAATANTYFQTSIDWKFYNVGWTFCQGSSGTGYCAIWDGGSGNNHIYGGQTEQGAASTNPQFVFSGSINSFEISGLDFDSCFPFGGFILIQGQDGANSSFAGALTGIGQGRPINLDIHPGFVNYCTGATAAAQGADILITDASAAQKPTKIHLHDMQMSGIAATSQVAIKVDQASDIQINDIISTGHTAGTAATVQTTANSSLIRMQNVASGDTNRFVAAAEVPMDCQQVSASNATWYQCNGGNRLGTGTTALPSLTLSGTGADTGTGWSNPGSSGYWRFSTGSNDDFLLSPTGPVLHTGFVYGMANGDSFSSTCATGLGEIAQGIVGSSTSCSSANDSGFFRSGNTVRVASDFTTANNTNLQTITGLSWTLPAVAKNWSFHCALLYSQATAAVADQFGIQVATNAPTNVAAVAEAFSSATAQTVGTISGLNTTTATPIVTFTPSAITTIFGAQIDGTFELPASANTVNIMVQTSNGADAVTVKRGSYCQLF